VSPLRAVVFDLFGTLVSEFPLTDWDAHFVEMGRIVGADPAQLRAGWEATAIERQTGKLGGIAENVREICRRLGVEPEDDAVRRALAVRWKLYERYFRPLPGAVETVRAVRERGYRTALVSMCAPDAPEMWHRSPFAGLMDAEVFSCEAGLRKPDPAIYLLAAGRLGVEPSACLYVGDGSYGELRGATEVGMTAVLVRDPAERDGTYLRPGVEPWDGATISRIDDVVRLVGVSSNGPAT
jgi:putative hydrolase of the HAD superfamily